jgi:hypothetical protein
MMMARVAAELKIEIAQRKEQEPPFLEPSSGLLSTHEAPSGPVTLPTGCPPTDCVVMD